jgi:signal transduction histidine kinase
MMAAPIGNHPSSAAAGIRTMHDRGVSDHQVPPRGVGAWLRNVPLSDPVDRRNAPMMQVLLILLGSLPPLMWLYRLLAVDVPWRPGETLSLLLSLGISVLALGCVALIRVGRFRLAVMLLLAAVSAAMMLSHLGSGFGSNRFEQPIQAVWLIVAGLMAGRRMLWLMYGWIALTFAVGTAVDMAGGEAGAAMNLAVDGLISALIFLFIAVVMDRSVTALRESLHAATQRGDELVRVNLRLEAEIAERERIRERLIHAQKVEAVGRLAGGVAHDFNHLLGLVLGYARRGQRADTPEQLAKALDGIDSAARRAQAVSQKLLSFSRREIAQPERFDACEVLRAMEPVLRQLFDPTVGIALDLPARAAPVRLDRVQFELVILNIAANANQAMPEGGEFRVSLRHAGDPTAIHIELADSGQGMTEAVRERALEPFFTTKPNGQGTGLGLSVAHDIIEAAGGTLRVDSSHGAGSVLHIQLPMAHDGQAARIDASA